MRDVLRRLMQRLTPWYDEDEAERREQSTQAVLERSEETRQQAREAIRKSYQRSDERLSRIWDRG